VVQFGYVEVGVNSNDPVQLTSNLDFKDTWHVAAGAQYQLDTPWRLDFDIAYDSDFQDGANVSPMLPTNAVWRFGVGAQKQESRTFSWGVAAAYAYGGTLDVNRESTAPVALGGRGDLAGSYNDTGVVFLTANFNWKFQGRPPGPRVPARPERRSRQAPLRTPRRANRRRPGRSPPG